MVRFILCVMVSTILWEENIVSISALNLLLHLLKVFLVVWFNYWFSTSCTSPILLYVREYQQQVIPISLSPLSITDEQMITKRTSFLIVESWTLLNHVHNNESFKCSNFFLLLRIKSFNKSIHNLIDVLPN